ncbi:hypothetical protein [Spirosoma sp. KNUC1025]|uniref:hypothetical protein n=1 Tax=Spirosoma sp. KNUC1025 TaxID=2894082 RepID=UPI0038635B6D|nr:hypothetical protein LN737_11360 [Spirosoma sp. KNUC1025]
MDNNKSAGKNSGLINWITVWGLIFGCIAFNLYIDNRQVRQDETWYRSQYEAESQRADSLHRAAVQLKQRIQEIEAVTVPKISTSQSNSGPKSSPTSAL